MNINLKIKLPSPPAKPAKLKARLPGEPRPFKELDTRKIQNIQRYDKLADNAARLRGSSIDEKFQEFLAGEVRQRKEIKQTLEKLIRQQQYINRFLLNCMTAE